jgi:perosamine synthetase
MKQIEDECIEPSFAEKNLLRILITVRKTIGNSSAYWTMVKAYRSLSRIGGFVGSSSEEELTGTIMPANYLKAISDIQCNEGIGEIVRVQSYISHRRSVAKSYSEILRNLGVKVPDYSPDHTFLKFPLLVTDREKFFALAMKENIELGEWFNSPIHPIQKEWEKWMYVKGSCPNAEYISEHMVNLPTHEGINSKKLLEIEKFLIANENYLIKGFR